MWSSRNKQEFTQEQFAYFIEDQIADFREPTGAKMLETALNFRVKQGIHFKSGMRLQDGTVQFEYSEQNEGAVGTQGKLSIPELFRIDIPVWEGLGQKKYQFEARFRWKLSGGNLALRYELIRPHKVIEQAFKDVLDGITAKLKDVPVIFGKPE